MQNFDGNLFHGEIFHRVQDGKPDLEGRKFGIFSEPLEKVDVPHYSIFGDFLAHWRLKEWHYHAVDTQDYYIWFFICNMGYVSADVIYVYDKRNRISFV